jgi:type 1 fimbria pilin
MKNLRKLSAGVALTLALALTAFAGEIPTPPCAPPGQIDTPPCSVVPGDMNTSEATSTAPSDYGTAKLANNGSSLGDIATDVVLNFLSLY